MQQHGLQDGRLAYTRGKLKGSGLFFYGPSTACQPLVSHLSALAHQPLVHRLSAARQPLFWQNRLWLVSAACQLPVVQRETRSSSHNRRETVRTKKRSRTKVSFPLNIFCHNENPSGCTGGGPTGHEGKTRTQRRRRRSRSRAEATFQRYGDIISDMKKHVFL